MNNILVIAAHPDDEILGCGGTLAKHVFNGDIVNTVIFGEGVTSREKVTNQHEKLNKIKIEAEEANKIIGVKNLYFEELPDNQLDQFNRLKIVKIIRIVDQICKLSGLFFLLKVIKLSEKRV